MISAMKVAASENSASRRDQTASRDTGSSITRRRTMAVASRPCFRGFRSAAEMA